MKLPKETKRYCPYCKKHTLQAVGTAKQRARSATHPMSRGSNTRLKARNVREGGGNQGRYSRKGPKDWKRKVKVTKRITVEYQCKECSKKHQIAKAIRTGRIMIGEKVTK